MRGPKDLHGGGTLYEKWFNQKDGSRLAQALGLARSEATEFFCWSASKVLFLAIDFIFQLA
jgi:hypothetical protein